MKTKMLLLHVIVLVFVFQISAFAQGEIDDNKKILFTNEVTPIIGLYSNGWGFGFIKGRRVAGQTKRLLDVEFAEVWHPQQVKLSYYGQSVTYGKLNDLYVLSFMTGRQKEVVSKADKRSVAIRFAYEVGLCVGLEKPVYYEVDTSVNVNLYHQYSVEKFSKARSFSVDRYSNMWFFYGLSETRFVPGLTARVFYDVDFSDRPNRIKSLVLGACGQVFHRKIEMMATNENQWWYFSLFVGWRFGWVRSQY